MKRAGTRAGLTCVLSVLLAAAPAPQALAQVHGKAAPPAAARPSKPSVTRVTPQTASTAGGAVVVLKGSGLTEVKRVLFGSTEATHVTVKNSKKLLVQAPAHDPGQVKIRVITKHGASKQTSATQFTYVAPVPVLSQVAPRAGPATGGTAVTLSGRDLGGATSVRFGGANAAFRAVSATTLTATAPAHPPGAVTVTITAPGGTTTLDEAFTYVAAPTVSDIEPDTGPVTGSTVTLFGTGFTNGATVTFDGAPASDVQLASSGTELTATTPAHAPGWVDVSVSTVGGTATLTKGFLYVGGASVTGVSPAVGPSAGGLFLILLGSGFTDNTLVTFGSKPSLDVDANGAGTVLTVLLPQHAAGTVDITVSNEGDSSTLPAAFTFVDAPALVTLSPPIGPAAGGTSVALTGTGFRAGMTVSFGGTPATLVNIISATQATATAPAHAPGAVDVAVSTPGGTGTLVGGYTYVAAPTLSTVSPSAAPTGGGTTVTLTGTGFRAGMQVSFGGVATTGVTIDTPSQATVTTPPHVAGSVNVAVTTPGGSDTRPNAFTYVAPPTLSTVSPSAGPTGGGTTVTVTGSGFRAGMQVTFGGVAATSVTIDSPSQATVTTPPHAGGDVAVVVTTPGGSDPRTDAFTYVDAPTLTSVSPSAAPTGGGTVVTLTGSGFRSGTTVTFGGAAGTAVAVVSSTQLTVTTPARASGDVNVVVTTPGGSVTLLNGFTYVAAPTLTAVSPAAGPLSGVTVSLTGSGFRSGMTVLFGTTPATGVAVSPDGTELTAVAPPHVAGAVSVSVATPGGSAAVPGAFTYLGVPDLVSVAPSAGPLAGGTTVTLTGTGFFAGMGVAFDGIPATGLSVTSATSATAVTPVHPTGAANVSVTTPGGSDTLGSAFTYVESPSVTAVSPPAGPDTGGTSVTVTGTGFRAGTTVTFGGLAAPVTALTSTSVTVTTPAHPAGDVSVVVSTPGGSDTLPNGYTYVVAPTVSSANPTAGPIAGGTSVTVTGTGFRAGMTVSFDGLAASVVSVTSTSATVISPPHAAGDVDVVVTTPGGSATLANGFTYVVTPTVALVILSAGPVAGGTAVTVTGTGFRAGMTVSFDGLAASVVSVTSTSATVISPPHAAGDVDVVVTTPGGSATLASAYTYVAAPTVASVSPSAGPVAGGTSATVTGTGFEPATIVTIDGLPAPVTSVTSTSVTVTTPPHVAGEVDVVVTTLGGSATLANGYTYVVAPTLVAVTPGNGTDTGGTAVTVTGDDLTDTTQVTFDGVPATDLVVQDDQTVTATTPAGVDGPVDVVVTTPGGTATVAGGFVYMP